MLTAAPGILIQLITAVNGLFLQLIRAAAEVSNSYYLSSQQLLTAANSCYWFFSIADNRCNLSLQELKTAATGAFNSCYWSFQGKLEEGGF